MPYRSDIFAQGEYYHIYNRGVNKQRIFFSTENYLYCLRLLKKYSGKYHTMVIAYCLMPNHYHLVLRQDGDIAISQYMQTVFNVYVQSLNNQLDRTGPLFEGRFKHKLIDRDEYILHLCRYVHLNPVKTGYVNDPKQWLFSNYLDWIGVRNGSLIDREFMSLYFTHPGEYEKSVRESQTDEKIEESIDVYLLDS